MGWLQHDLDRDSAEEGFAADINVQNRKSSNWTGSAPYHLKKTFTLTGDPNS